jgi:hypothetical protein
VAIDLGSEGSYLKYSCKMTSVINQRSDNQDQLQYGVVTAGNPAPKKEGAINVIS